MRDGFKNGCSKEMVRALISLVRANGLCDDHLDNVTMLVVCMW